MRIYDFEICNKRKIFDIDKKIIIIQLILKEINNESILEKTRQRHPRTKNHQSI